MHVAKLPAAEMEGRCLAWLESRAEDALPVVLLSGGPVSENARYHVLVQRPRFVVRGSVGGESGIVVAAPDGTIRERCAAEQLLALLRRLAAENAGESTGCGGGPRPFSAGFVGYLGYDLAWLFEYGLPRYLPAKAPLPDVWFGFYETALVLDRERSEVSGDKHAVDELLALAPPEAPRGLQVSADTPWFHREDYEAAVERVRQHCIRGDIFQADLSRRISLGVDGTPADLFKRLVSASPAAFMAYVGLGSGRAVASASPEEFVRVRGRAVRTQPIKGTRPRGVDAATDRDQCEALLASEKDVAELTMIVDLMRNDLGRVAQPGSVHVTEFPVLMTLPQVHHLVGTIVAVLDGGRDVWDLIAASFPPGSISGAPKPRAIEILEQVERSRRGVYTGAIGYIEPGGNAHLNVAIRSAEIAGGRLRFGVGGGITALSDPTAEFEETRDKARGLALALGLEDLP